MKSVHHRSTWGSHLLGPLDIFYCVAFFWRADEARSGLFRVNSLQTAAFTVIRACEVEQPPLPLNLSVFAVCLRSGAIAQGDAPRGIVAVDAEVSWVSDPSGHMFRFHFPFLGSEEAIDVYWLPGHINVQWG